MDTIGGLKLVDIDDQIIKLEALKALCEGTNLTADEEALRTRSIAVLMWIKGL